MSNAYKIIHYFISGASSREMKEKVWKWLIDSHGQPEKEAALKQVWDESSYKADQSTAESYRNFCRKAALVPPSKITHNRFYRIIRAAVVLLIPLFSKLAAYLYTDTYTKNIEQVEYLVPQGKKHEIILPDGSHVYLNAGTLLVYPKKFIGKMRTVYLMGEGNFHVKKDQKHPFIVKTSSLKIKVLGTKFNVCAYGNEDKTVTTLESGSVMIQKPTEEPITVLSPNEQLEYHNTTGEFQKRKIDASIYSGWTKGELNFVSQSLKEIVKSLERTYNVHILLPPTLNTTDLYTIKFKHQSSINDVLNIITKTIGNLSYTIEDDNIILEYLPKKKGGK